MIRRNANCTPPDYEDKFATFIDLCATTQKDDIVAVVAPQVLGDSYGEIVESLNRLADAEVRLAIVPRSERTSSQG